MADETGGGRVLRRLVLLAGAAGVGWFAVQGGEYGTTDLWRQRRQKQRVEAKIAALQHEVDSLERAKHGVLTDPHVQERIAREEFGMVRGDKELLYRFADPSDTSRARP